MFRRASISTFSTSAFRNRLPAVVLVSVALLAASLGAIAGAPAIHVTSGSPGAGTAIAPAPATPRSAPVPAVNLPAVSASPLAKFATIPVGAEPEFATFDPSNGYLYVPNWGANNVSVLDGTTQVASVPVGSVPFSTSYDPTHGYVYVVNQGSNNVSIISGTHVIANVPVGTAPVFATYDGFNEKMYVANSGSASITVLNGTVVNATVSVGSNPSHPVFGSLTGGGGGGGGGWAPGSAAPAAASNFIFVPNSGSNNVSVLGGTYGTTVVTSIPVGTHPQFAIWDPNNVWLYVPNEGSNNLSVLTTTSVLYTVPTGNSPYSATLDAANGQVYVANYGSGTVTAIGGVNVNTVVRTIPVGTNPEFITEAPSPKQVLVVPNTGSGNISVLNATTDLGSILAGSGPIFSTPDPATKELYVQNFASANITLVGPSLALTFTAHGLPAGTTWSVHVDAPSESGSNTTVGRSGQIVLSVLGPGIVNFSLSPPSGYGVAKVSGPNFPSQTAVNISVPETLTVTFAPIENVTFAEVGLPNGTAWWVDLTPALPHGGPAGANVSGSGTTITVSLVADSYHFRVAPEPNYRAAPGHGSVGVPHHAITKTIHYRLVAAHVTFVESHLRAGTHWQVNITGGPALYTYPFIVTGSTSSLHLFIVNGTYTFQVAPVAGYAATPGTGTFTVAAPHASTIAVSWAATPGPGIARVSGGATPSAAPGTAIELRSLLGGPCCFATPRWPA